MVAATILLVEDDRELRDLVTRALEEENFQVSAVGTGREAMRRACSVRPDAIVIDIGLPDADGRDLCQAIRAQSIDSPVLFLTARDALTDRLAGFAAGGDDYLTKPFSTAELGARLRAIVARGGSAETVAFAGLELDPTSFTVRCGGAAIELTPTEFRLLGALAAHAGKPVQRRELTRTAWPEGAVVHDNTIDVYIARLRRKLRAATGAPGIKTVRGVGYRLI